MDLLDNLSGSTDTLAPAEASFTEQASSSFDYWENPNVPLVTVDPAKLKSSGLSFTVGLPMCKDATAELVEQFKRVAKALFSKGYTFRVTEGSKDMLHKAIMGMEGAKVETYLAWKSYNSDIALPTLIKPAPDAYGIAATSHKYFAEKSPFIRAILANQVHGLLGKTCKDPVTLYLTHSPDGGESLGKGANYKSLVGLGFTYKVAISANIPIFNLKNGDAIERIGALVKSKEPTTEEV